MYMDIFLEKLKLKNGIMGAQGGVGTFKIRDELLDFPQA